MTYKVVRRFSLPDKVKDLRQIFNVADSQDWFSFRHCSNGTFWLEYKNNFIFLIDADKKVVHCYSLQKNMSAGLEHYISTQIRSFILCLNGNECLHGTALLKDNKTIVLLGDSGMGKSTLAAYMMNQGWKLLGDDLIEFDADYEQLKCQKTVYLKLFPKISKHLNPHGENLGTMNSKTKKEVWKFENQHLRVRPHAFFNIGHRKGEISCRKLSGIESFMALQASTFNVSFWNQPRLRSCLSQFAHVAKRIPTYQLNYPKKMSVLIDVEKVLAADNVLQFHCHQGNKNLLKSQQPQETF